MQPKVDIYNDFSSQYAAYIARRGERGVENDRFTSAFFNVVGDVSGLTVLDAGCGEGYISRILTARGARVTGIDISTRLIEMARAKDPEGKITYQVADMSQPLPAYRDHFDMSASYFVLNDIYDYRGFLATLGSVLKPGGRALFFLNNPYSMVLRGQVVDYFDTDKAFPYISMREAGVNVYYYQRTLEEYLDASFVAGFQLQRLVDVPTPEGTFKRTADTLHPVGHHFPYCMILSLVKA